MHVCLSRTQPLAGNRRAGLRNPEALLFDMDPAPAKESLCARKQNFVFQGLLRITITTTATVTATVTVTVITTAITITITITITVTIAINEILPSHWREVST